MRVAIIQFGVVTLEFYKNRHHLTYLFYPIFVIIFHIFWHLIWKIAGSESKTSIRSLHKCLHNFRWHQLDQMEINVRELMG